MFFSFVSTLYNVDKISYVFFGNNPFALDSFDIYDYSLCISTTPYQNSYLKCYLHRTED